ncbi:MAG: response regulator transcription factor [Holophagaceae bacterium]|nr:response regulator transcription factor [Holophagaceae bacterium]
MTIRLALADDHRMFRESLRMALAKEPDLEIVGEASSGHETMAMVAQVQPEVLLLDIALPDSNGIEVASRLHRLYPALQIIALTGYADKVFIGEMLKTGAKGYIVKSAGSEDLIRGIHAVVSGRNYLCAESTQALLGKAPSGGGTPSPPVTVLTNREQQVLRLLAEGQRSLQIAEELGISAATVEVYRRKIKAKLDLHTTAELTRYAIREGLASI